MGIKVISSGSLTTVQDLGRPGYQAMGFSVSGALDKRSARIANLLAGNDEGAALLEMTLMGGIFEFEEDTVFALTGADMGAELNKEPVMRYSAVFAKAGDTLACGFTKLGLRGYLAFGGGIDVPAVMGSCSTNLRVKLGGYEGRALKAGDVLPVNAEGRKKAVAGAFGGRGMTAPGSGSRAAELLEEAARFENRIKGGACVLRVVPGPQEEYFTEKGIRTFYSTPYQITPDSDRMGCKLKGEAVEYKDSVDIISDGIALGAIQIPSGGQPIIMLSDRQTTGGYAKIGTVIAADIEALVQNTIGGRVTFERVSVKEAAKIYRAEEKERKKIAARLGGKR